MSKILLTIIFLVHALQMAGQSSLNGKRICIDPGHGGTAATDSYRVGKNGEREEWINLRVALMLKDMLVKKGASVLLTRNSDDKLDLSSRAKMARDSSVDLFISIHHNATADSNVNIPIVYFHGAVSENRAGVKLASLVANRIAENLFAKGTPFSVVSDFTIFPEKGAAVLRETYGIPGILSEASFFTNEEEEYRLKSEDYNRKEALAFLQGIEDYFNSKKEKISKKKIPFNLPPFAALQEAERMKPEALRWLHDFEEGRRWMAAKDRDSLLHAYELFTRSARSFPDSWVARECHLLRADILTKLNRHKEARIERLRAEELYWGNGQRAAGNGQMRQQATGNGQMRQQAAGSGR